MATWGNALATANIMALAVIFLGSVTDDHYAYVLPLIFVERILWSPSSRSSRRHVSPSGRPPRGGPRPGSVG